MHLAHLAYLIIPDPLRNLPAPVERVALVTHLRGHLVFLGQARKQSGLIDRMCKGFLYIDVLAQRHGMGSHTGMGVVGRGHQYGIDGLAYLVKHHTPVLEAAGIGIVVKRLSGIFPVHIAQGHNVLRAHLLQIAAAHSAHAHSGNVEFVTWRHMTVAAA